MLVVHSNLVSPLEEAMRLQSCWTEQLPYVLA